MVASIYTQHLPFLSDKSVVELEVIFLALDKSEDVKKLLSLELSGVWMSKPEIPDQLLVLYYALWQIPIDERWWA